MNKGDVSGAHETVNVARSCGMKEGPSMQRVLKAALVGAIGFSLATPAMAQETPDPVTADTVVATVNGTEITVGHMLVLRSRLPQQYQNAPAETLFEGILEQVIQQEILRGANEGLSAASRYVLDNEERALAATEVANDYARDRLTEEAIQAAYDAEYGAVEPEMEYNASHILVETEEEAQAILAELEAGADFTELARERSTGPSGPNGGNLGWFGKGMMVAPFEEAVVAMDEGAVSDPVQTQFGWHVVKLNETRQATAPALEEVRDEIVNRLQREAIETAIAELTETADVSRIEAGEIDPSVIGDMSLLQE